jgi:hypothetical protein
MAYLPFTNILKLLNNVQQNYNYANSSSFILWSSRSKLELLPVAIFQQKFKLDKKRSTITTEKLLNKEFSLYR